MASGAWIFFSSFLSYVVWRCRVQKYTSGTMSTLDRHQSISLSILIVITSSKAICLVLLVDVAVVALQIARGWIFGRILMSQIAVLPFDGLMAIVNLLSFVSFI